MNVQRQSVDESAKKCQLQMLSGGWIVYAEKKRQFMINWLREKNQFEIWNHFQYSCIHYFFLHTYYVLYSGLARWSSKGYLKNNRCNTAFFAPEKHVVQSVVIPCWHWMSSLYVANSNIFRYSIFKRIQKYVMYTLAHNHLSSRLIPV